MEFDFEKAIGIAAVILVTAVPSCTGLVEYTAKSGKTNTDIAKINAVKDMVAAGANPLDARCSVDYNEPMCSLRASK